MTSGNQVQGDTTWSTPIDVVIMAAGKGTRMKSRLPKVLHPLAGRSLLRHVLDTAQALQVRQAVVITGHGAIEVEAACAMDTVAAGQLAINFVRQEPQLGCIQLRHHDDVQVRVLQQSVSLQLMVHLPEQ